jgi:fatty-acyl-CoA synthase
MMPMAPLFRQCVEFSFLAPYTGGKLVLPGRNYEPEKLYELLQGEQVTITCGVPRFCILTDWLHRTGGVSRSCASLSSGRRAAHLIDKLERDYGVEHVRPGA